jgi:hypothetical protein
MWMASMRSFALLFILKLAGELLYNALPDASSISALAW